MKVVALAGGVGGAKLVDGLASVLPAEDLTAVVNTGDDFEHLGLSISPDLDTVMYTLAGLANPETGWGRADETWSFLETLETLGGPTWFRLGDRDLALHLERARRLRDGETLSEVTTEFCEALDIQVRLLPMSDDPIRTIVHTDEGDLAFQEYFVARACEPMVRSFEFVGADLAKPAPGVIEAINQADSVIFCPSNPWVSLDPILAVHQIREAVQAKPTIGVSPIIGGQALKGPAAKMYTELNIDPSAYAVAQHFPKIDAFVIDTADADWMEPIRALGVQPFVTQTVMDSAEARRRLAQEVLEFIGELEIAI
ncbi:MAG: 2-phospho-L-lactate transferase [Anaerolineales bacterium]